MRSRRPRLSVAPQQLMRGCYEEYCPINVKPKEMESVIRIASYIADRYQMVFGERLGEMKLHKLLYFAQRECLIQMGEPLFGEEIRAWKYGPVVPCVRSAYKYDRLCEMPSEESQKKYQPVLDFVMKEYAPSGVWTLVSVSHGQKSWQRARVGYAEQEASDVLMKLEDIREDAEDAKARRSEVESLKMFYEWLEDKKSPLLKKLPHADFD